METAPGTENVQTNVRVAEADKPLVLQVAQQLRSDPAFRDKLRRCSRTMSAPVWRSE